MRNFIAACLLAPTLSFAADNVTQIVRVHGDPLEIRNLMEGANVRVDGNRNLGAIVIKGNAEDVAKGVQTVKDLDSLSEGEQTRNIEVVVSLLAGTDKAVPGTREVGDRLSPVVKQLRSLFPYSTYSVLNTSVIRSRQGAGAMVSGVLRTLTGEGAGFYTVTWGSVDANGTAIHITRFQLKGEMHPPGDKEPFQSDLDFDVKEGQQVVVASNNLDDSNATIFVVVSARVVP